MTELLTAAQMRAIEQAAIDAGDVTGLELMERAGQGVVAAIFEEWPELAPAVSDARGPVPASPELLRTDEKGKRAVILCGPGNNGGDGFVVARLLYGLGWKVEVLFGDDADKLPADAHENYERWALVGPIYPLDDNLTGAKNVEPDIYVDALFGTGLSRPIGKLGMALRHLDDCVAGGGGQIYAERMPYHPPVVAIDMPSGMCADSGEILVPEDTSRLPRFAAFCAAADLTVTFHRSKVGHFLGFGPAHCGKVVIKDISLKPNRSVLTTEPVNLTGRGGFLGKYATWGARHKYEYGHALILSGPMGKGGAARLATRGALRIGAGVVSVGCPPSALLEHATQLTAIMTCKIADAEALTSALDDDRINALCVGPGLGLGEREAALVDAAMPKDQSKRCVVFDADALTLISQSVDLFAKLNANCVLTPHAGEFARLFPDIAERLNGPATTGPAYSKVDATRDAAKRAGCVVLFKGPDTVIAHPDGRCSINAALYERSAPWLATAGSGDVLAGFIAGLLARGFSPMQAAESGAWLHVECARSFGPGLIAEDLPEELPKVFRDLGF